MIAIKLALVIPSFLGYMLLTRKLLMIRREFIPIFVFSSVACIIYLFGLLHILLAGSIFVLLVGLLAFARFGTAFLRNRHRPVVHITFFNCFFVAGILLFFTVIAHSRLIHYDNFSHWGIVLKYMLSTDTFPTAKSALIDYKNYPLGITSFLYYFCRFTGHSQPIMLMAQGLLIFACFYAMFGIISKKKRFLLYAFMGLGLSTLSLFNLTVRINNLLVDFLLPIYTLAIFAAAYCYRKDVSRALIISLPIAALSSVTKNTGIIFAAIGLIYVLYILIKHRKAPSRRKFSWQTSLALFREHTHCSLEVPGNLMLSKKSIKRMKENISPFWRKFSWQVPLTLFGAFTPYLLWVLHTKYAFAGVENKFEMGSFMISKTTDQMNEIISLFWKSSIDLTSRPAIGVLAYNLIAIMAFIFATQILKKKWALLKALIAMDTVLILYYMGILGLYLFSMPWDEALWLAGFERYTSSIVVLFAGALVLCATVDIENSFYYRIDDMPEGQAFYSYISKGRYQKAVLACLAVSVVLLMSEYNGMKFNMGTYDTSLLQQIQSLTGDRWIKGGEVDTSRYLFYAPDKDAQVTNYYMQYAGRYFLYAPNVDGICLFWEENMDNLLSEYDYLVIVESDYSAKYLLKKHYGVTGEKGIYRIDNMDGKISLVMG